MNYQEATPQDQVKLLRTYTHHRALVQVALQRLTQELDRRSLAHDLSKLQADEFDGFARINQIAREHPYGSQEYKDSLDQEREVIDLHYQRNSHHPEHHRTGQAAEDMGFLDLIEMVCDWWSAWQTYGAKDSWENAVKKNEARFRPGFTNSQWWLVEQMDGGPWLSQAPEEFLRRLPFPQ